MNSSATKEQTGSDRNISIDYLRSFLAILVVLHHSAAAYMSFQYGVKSTFINTGVPIIDNCKNQLLDLFVALNDAYFMPLFFLISGVYFWPSLNRQGAKAYLLGRVKRLGIPFLAITSTIIPLAYWASNMTIAAKPLTSFWIFYPRFFSFGNGKWPPGPVWFLWVLLIYSILAVVAYEFFPAMVSKCARKPLKSFLMFFSGILFLPLFVFVGPDHWSAFAGPLVVQTSRIGLYFSFFFWGTLIGLSGKNMVDVFPQNYLKLLLVGIIVYTIYIVTVTHPISANITVQRIAMGTALLAVCIIFNLGFPGLFLNIDLKHNSILDNLSTNSYGIFLVHYPIVIWIQYGLLQTSFSALTKFIIVGISSLLLSWGVSGLIRKNSFVRSLI